MNPPSIAAIPTELPPVPMWSLYWGSSKVVFSPGSPHAENIYKFTRMAIDPNITHTRFHVPRGMFIVCACGDLYPPFHHVAGLTLIASHAAQFREYLAKDHEVRR